MFKNIYSYCIIASSIDWFQYTWKSERKPWMEAANKQGERELDAVRSSELIVPFTLLVVSAFYSSCSFTHLHTDSPRWRQLPRGNLLCSAFAQHLYTSGVMRIKYNIWWTNPPSPVWFWRPVLKLKGSSDSRHLWHHDSTSLPPEPSLASWQGRLWLVLRKDTFSFY